MRTACYALVGLLVLALMGGCASLYDVVVLES